MTAGEVLLTPPPDVQAALDAAVDAFRAAQIAEVAWRQAMRERDAAQVAADRARREVTRAALLAEVHAMGWEAMRPRSTDMVVSDGMLTVRVQLAQGRPNYVADWLGSRAYGLGSGPTLRDALAALALDLRRRYRGRAPLDMAARLESAIGGAP